MISFQLLLYVLISLTLGLAVAFGMYGRASKWGKRKWPLFLLRFCTVASITWLICGWIEEQIKTRELNPVFALLIDNSQSVFEKEKDYHRLVQEEIIPAYQKGLVEGVELRVFLLNDEWVGDSLMPYSSSPVQSVFEGIKGGFGAKRLLGVSLVSDGIFESDLDPTGLVSFAHFVGDSIQNADWSIVEVQKNRSNFVGEKNEIRVICNPLGEVGPAKLVLMAGNRVLQEKKLTTQGQSVSVFFVESPKPKKENYTFQIIPLGADLNPNNNKKSVLINFQEKKELIWVVGSGLGPDVGGIRRVLELNHEVDLRYVNVRKIKNQGGKPDAIILHGGLNGNDEIILQAYLYQNKVGLIHLLPSINDINGAGILEKGLIGNLYDEVGMLPNARFNYFQWALADAPEIPLLAPSGSWTFKDSWFPFIFKQIGGLATQSPLAAIRVYKGKKELVLIGSGFWRWVGSEAKPSLFTKQLESAYRWVSAPLNADQILLDYEALVFKGSKTRIEAEILDDNFEKRTQLDFQIDFGNGPITMQENRGVYSVELEMPLVDSLPFQVTTTLNSGEVNQSGLIQGTNELPELNQLVGDSQKLKRFQNKGYFAGENWGKENLRKALGELEGQKVREQYTASLEPIQNMFWLIFITLSLSTEFIIRKLGGF